MNALPHVRTLTSGPKHHLFGYYSVTPWNQSESHLVCLESDFQDHLPAADESAAIGLVDAKTGTFEKVTETRAWNLQQGTWLYWNPLAPDSEIIHNDRIDGVLVTAIYNIHTGQRRVLPRPINALSHDGKHALCLTYGRLQRTRKVVGYGGAEDPYPNDFHPANDGIFLMDMETGDVRLIVSIQEVYEHLVADHPYLADRDMWFNHVAFNTDDSRFYFLERCWQNSELQTGMITANLDGSDLRYVIPFGTRASHADWRNETEIAATFTPRDRGREHVLVTDGDVEDRFLAEGELAFDGHMSFSPDRQWMVTDKNVAETMEKWLLLVRMADEAVTVLHRFPMQQLRWLGGDLRCDLHPRWNRSGTQVCVDAIAADGTRQLHIVEPDLA